MAYTGKCPYCGSLIRSDQTVCPGCGAPNEQYVADTPRTVNHPTTIEELKEYCAERGMPLLRMRFFIGVDTQEPRAFGIYRDGDKVVVYKNKADGSRAVRYEGPDEEFAVNEIYQKLLQECHNRGIYPDGKPKQAPPPPPPRNNRPKKKIFTKRNIIIAVIVIILLGYFGDYLAHTDDGYYRFDDTGKTYYHYGSDWYYSYDNDDANYWYAASSVPVDEDEYPDYSVGEDWSSDWDVGDFKESSTWDDINYSYDSGSSYSSGSSYDDDDDWDWGSSDYDDDDDWDSWDSSDSDWDSDW